MSEMTEERVHKTKSTGSNATPNRPPRATVLPRVVRDVIQSPGQSLDARTRANMEARLGHDFARVRVHIGTPAEDSAEALAAEAYTSGDHIVFNRGRYSPQSQQGDALLAHELTHVVEQRPVSGSRGETGIIQCQKSESDPSIPDWRQVYERCRRQVFGTRKQLAWGSRSIPSLSAVDLILEVAGARPVGEYGPADLATVWAIEKNFQARPENHENPNGSVDVGPVQINYEAHSPGMPESQKKAIFGTTVGAGETFNGSPRANLKYGWRYLLKHGHTGYNPGSKKRAAAVAALLPELKRFFSCLIGARTVVYEPEEEVTRALSAK